MEDEDNLDATEEDQIEWVSSSSLSSAPKRSREIARPARQNTNKNTNILKIPLKQIFFNSSINQCITAPSGSMALFLYERTREISVCLNDMKDEISFRIEEVEEFKIIRDNSIIFRLRPNFARSYYRHPDGYRSFKDKSKSVIAKSDPTGGKLNGISCINFKPDYSVDREKINLVDRSVRKMIDVSNNAMVFNNQTEAPIVRNNDYFHRRSYKAPPVVNTQNFPPRRGSTNSDDSPRDTSPYSYDNTIIKRELYITCICPTQKRAMIYPSDGIFSHFQFHIKQRFNWKWERMWYKNKIKNGSWSILNDESAWIAVKKQAINTKIPRIEVFMR